MDGCWVVRLSGGSNRRLYINPCAAEDSPFAPEGFTLSDFQPVRDEAWLVPLLEGEDAADPRGGADQ